MNIIWSNNRAKKNTFENYFKNFSIFLINFGRPFLQKIFKKIFLVIRRNRKDLCHKEEINYS